MSCASVFKLLKNSCPVLGFGYTLKSSNSASLSWAQLSKITVSAAVPVQPVFGSVAEAVRVSGPNAKPVGSKVRPETPKPLMVASCGVTTIGTAPSSMQSTRSLSAIESPTTGEL